MFDLLTPVKIAQFVSICVAILAIYFGYKRSKSEMFLLLFVFISITIYGRYDLRELITTLNIIFPFINDGLIYIKDFEPELISSPEIFINWFSLFFGAFMTWVFLIATYFIIPVNRTLRGTSIKAQNEMLRQLKALGKPQHPLRVGQFYIPLKLEPLSAISIGEPRSGKTQISNTIQKATISRKEKSLNVDINGESYKKLAQKNDFVLSIDYEESIATSLFAEIQRESDCEMIANAFIPQGDGESKDWNGYARNLLTILIRWCWNNGKTQNQHLTYFIKQASIKELENMTKGTFAQRLFDKGSEKMLSNVLSILSQNMTCLELLLPTADKDSFSLRKWISGESNNNLWIIYNESSSAATLPLRTAWLEILIREALNLEPDENRKLWFFFDELASNGRIESLSQAVSRGRKYGLVLHLCLQSLSQLYKIYGRDEATSILGSIGHYVILRTPDPDTSDYLSRAIGDKEIQRKQVSLSKSGSSSQNIIETKRAVLASEISSLSDLNGYIKFAGVGWSKVKIPLLKLSNKNVLTPKKIDNSLLDQFDENGVLTTSNLSFDEI